MNDEFLKNALPWVLFAFGIIVFTIVAKNKNRNSSTVNKELSESNIKPSAAFHSQGK